MRKNGFLTFITACIPGCGQMYQGYMRRGVSLAFWFWGIAAVAAMLGVGVLALLMPVVWAYAFFDTFNIRALAPDQRARFYDDFLPNSEWLRKHRLNNLPGKLNGSKIAGWALIIVGVLILYNNFFSRFYYYLYETVPFLANIFNSLPQAAIAAVVIWLGVRMLRSQNKTPPPHDDVVPFRGEENEHE